MSGKSKSKSKPKALRRRAKPLVPKWKLFRAKEPLLSVFMWGVNHTVRELSHVPPPMLLMPDDFKAYSKIKVDNQSFNKDHMPSHFKVKEYCPNVFRNLRERFGVDEQEYLNSLTSHAPIWVRPTYTQQQQQQRLQTPSTSLGWVTPSASTPSLSPSPASTPVSPRLSPFTFPPTLLTPSINGILNSANGKFAIKVTQKTDLVQRLLERLNQYHERSVTWDEPVPAESPGRSGSHLYTTYDEKFILKTMTAEEVAELHSILRQYHGYVVEKHGKTLLPQYLGLYRLTVDGNETYVIVMRNILGRKYAVHKKYDLKGSTVQRAASDKERAKDLPTLKDNDFLDDNIKLHLPYDAEQKLVDMLASDTNFLSKLNLMDYSLLVGIHDCERAREERQAQEPVQPTTTGESSGGEVADDEEEGGQEAAVDQPTPPDSPIPSTGAFAPCLQESRIDLDHEFYAINSRNDAPKSEIYFIGLVDILTYYGMKKRTAFAAKSVKYGAEAEISTVAPDQYGRRLCEFVSRHVIGREPGSVEAAVDEMTIAPKQHTNRSSGGRTASQSSQPGECSGK